MSCEVQFSIPFQAEMNGPQVARMASGLGLTFHSSPQIALPFFAFARLDADSGLFLLRESEDRWRLECRTYGEPPLRVVEGWRTRAAWVVGLIDPPAPGGSHPSTVGAVSRH